MTYLSHCHPSFGSVFSIEAVNEPIMDAAQTPGLGECKRAYVCDWSEKHHSDIEIVYKNFVKTVRLVEWFLEKKLPEFQALKVAPNITDIHEIITEASTMDWSGPLSLPVVEAFINAFSMLCDTAEEINWRVDSCPCQEISPITTTHVFFLFSVGVMG